MEFEEYTMKDAIFSPNPILIVEDDKKTSSLISVYLEREGFTTLAAYDGQQALTLAERRQPLFVILDLMLPKVDGWELCRTLRHASDVPILILTAREEEMDRIQGLSLGADDYVVKPFSPRELVARVKAIMRRARPEASKRSVSYNGLVFDHERRKVTVEDKPVALTPLELKLLQALVSAPGRVFSRDELLHVIYPSGELAWLSSQSGWRSIIWPQITSWS
jgi:DNA-binding response OmpR family regulator